MVIGMEYRNELISAFPFWNKLLENEKEILEKGCLKEAFEKGTLLNRTNENCKGAMILQTGQIRVYIISDEGREVTLYRLRKGDVCVLSASCLLDSIAFEVLIEAVEPTEVLLLPSAILHQVMKTSLHVELYLQKQANERFSDVMWTMQQILFLRADKRIAIFLWDELTKTGDTTLTYTHDEIARYIGSAREVVTRMLKYFASEGVVSLSRGKVEITNKEKLKSYL